MVDAFTDAWAVVKMAVHTCPVCGSGEIRRLNPDDVDLYCDNCEASWGINFIGGKSLRVETGPKRDRPYKEYEKIQAHREKWKKGRTGEAEE
jgi:uncharacterized Zn finger protein (UPF0148 family)